jgi:phosphoadenosine phosphosulfate reductase
MRAVAATPLEAPSGASAMEIIEWAESVFGDRLVVSSSFGIQSAVTLHLATSVRPDIPVIWVDTGYLPADTYRYADILTRRLNLNLKVYQSEITPARMEALHGRLWAERDVEKLDLYDEIRKVEPMRRALRELDALAWLAGVRAAQTDHRGTLDRVERRGDRYKIHPILHWSSKDVHDYMRSHDLPLHPLFDRGYATVGDWHSSRPLRREDQHERDTRYRGIKQECGLHLPESPGEAESLESSGL